MSDTFGDILSDIEKADLKTHEGRAALEARIRSKYAIRDILLIRSFIRGGIFISTTEPSADSLLRKIANGEKVDVRWTQTSAGIVTETHEEGRELTRLWEALVQSCFLYIGAASILGMYDARMLAGYAFADEGDGPTVYDLTPDALIRAVPKEYRKQLDTASRFDRIEKTIGQTHQGVAALVQHLPDAKKPTVISWQEAVAIMKRKGGGVTERTLRNWIKAGVSPKTKTPISWDNLSTVAAWSAWVDAYLAALNSRASCRKFISEQAGIVMSQKSRRMNTTA